MRIGILGGSFDPVHNGHLVLARESEKQFKLGKILFVPTHLSPLKKEESKRTPSAVRARMVELAIHGEPHWEICDLELRRPGVSYSVETLRELRKIYPPPHELFFIAGADAFHDLNQWKDPEEILKLCQWIVAPRPGFDLPKDLPPRFHLLRLAPMEISASQIRQKLESGEDVSRWIPERAREYLIRRKVYQAGGAL